VDNGGQECYCCSLQEHFCKFISIQGSDLADDCRYVAMHAMQEDSHEHSHNSANGYTDGGSAPRTKPKPQMKDTLAAVGGMLIPLLTQIGHHH
jgi:hypothetical protein